MGACKVTKNKSSHDARNKACTPDISLARIKLTQPAEIGRKVAMVERDAASRPSMTEGKLIRRRSHGLMGSVVLPYDT